MTIIETATGPIVVDLADGNGPRAKDTVSVTNGAVASSRRNDNASVRAVVLAAPAVLAGLAVWFLIYGLVLTGLQQHVSQSRLYDKFRLQLASETAPLAEPVKTGAPVALIDAQAAGIHNLVVVEGTTSRLLMSGPGHLTDTPLPGQVGTSTILGRSVTFGSPFRHITHMRLGDIVTVTTGQGVFHYAVQDARDPGSPMPPGLKSGGSRLTLVTSAGSGWRSGWAPTHAVYVDALLTGAAQPAPQGVPATVSRASDPMESDPSAIVALLFWLEALAVVALALGWAWGRWGRPQSWIVGAPIFLAVLWATSGTIMRFLPNLL